MLNARENMTEMLNWGKPEYVPMTFEAFKVVGMGTSPILEEPFESGTDPFGVKWIVTTEGPMVDTSYIMLEDIADWKEKIVFPDIDKIDITQIAKEELKNIDRSSQMLVYYNPCGLFERLAAFMGFAGALMALIEDPDSCEEFFDALADYKIKLANKIIDAYNIDIFVYFDDLATARGTFMSPNTYRNIIKPYHKKIVEAVNARGVVFEQHTCGKCEALLEDYVEIGVKMWHSAQPMNDLSGIQKRFKGRLIIEGGWDSSGPCSYINATMEQLREETRRCIEEYGKQGGFILMPTIMNEKGNALLVGDDRIPALIEEWQKYCKF